MDGGSLLHSSIVTSTLWGEELHVRVVFMTMLAIKNKDHFVSGAAPGLARVANVDLEQCLDALNKLESPDEYSRTPDDDGRRIATVDGGWIVINGEKYNRFFTEERQRQQTAARVRRHRARSVTVTQRALQGVTETPSDPDPDADAEGRGALPHDGEGQEDKTSKSTPLVNLIRSHWPELDQYTAEQVAQKLLSCFPGADLVAAVNQAHKTAPPGLQPGRVYTWIANELRFIADRAERDKPQGRPAIVPEYPRMSREEYIASLPAEDREKALEFDRLAEQHAGEGADKLAEILARCADATKLDGGGP